MRRDQSVVTVVAFRRPAPLVAALAGLAILFPVSSGPSADAEATTRVFIDGQATPVYFSDGDSFRVLAGPWAGRNTRLAGFNTLESYGPVHQWGEWHPFELFVNAKMATLNARRGVWHCTTEGETDTYGRVLVDCPDLSVDQIRKGLAHAMNIDDTPSRPEYLRAQQQAIRERRGMWRHGVPEFVLTSLHSIDEDPERAEAYNRMISTRDGHSQKWQHTNVYSECQWVCAEEVVADDAKVREIARRLRADAGAAPALSERSNLLVIEAVDRFARLGELPEWVTEDERSVLLPRLRQAKSSGDLGELSTQRGSCVLYVEFNRRYGRERPECLRGHGVRP